MKVARDYDQLCRILVAAFDSNDFDAFELNVKLLLTEHPLLQHLQTIPSSHGDIHFRWSRPSTPILPGSGGARSLTLDLLTTSNRRRGTMIGYRRYAQQPRQLDVNLLTSEFPVALADALDRFGGRAVEMVPRTDQTDGLVEAAG